MILVLIEHAGEKISKSALAVIGAAHQAKAAHGHSRIVGVVIGGSGSEAAAKTVAHYGLDEVVCIEGASVAQYLAPTYTEVLGKLCQELQPKMVLALSSTQGKDLLPRVAHHFEAGQVSDCLHFFPEKRYRRPMFAGNVIAEVVVHSEMSVVTVRSAAFEPAPRQDAQAPVKLRPELAPVAAVGTEFVSFHTVQSERPELSDAEVVVSGGRALKSAESFQSVVIPLADAFGGAVGASRAAVDSGYAPNDWQVGQTGKVVAPKVYVAVGISGAIQHLAGMKDSKVIVAINKDPDAPIFEVADYGLVADLFEVVPQLTEEVKKIRSSS